MSCVWTVSWRVPTEWSEVDWMLEMPVCPHHYVTLSNLPLCALISPTRKLFSPRELCSWVTRLGEILHFQWIPWCLQNVVSQIYITHWTKRNRMYYVIHHYHKPQMRVGKFVVAWPSLVPSHPLLVPSPGFRLTYTELPAQPLSSVPCPQSTVLSLTSF